MSRRSFVIAGAVFMAVILLFAVFVSVLTGDWFLTASALAVTVFWLAMSGHYVWRTRAPCHRDLMPC